MVTVPFRTVRALVPLEPSDLRPKTTDFASIPAAEPWMAQDWGAYWFSFVWIALKQPSHRSIHRRRKGRFDGPPSQSSE